MCTCIKLIIFLSTKWKKAATMLFFSIVAFFISMPTIADLCLLDAAGLNSASCTANDLTTALVSKFAGPNICVDGTTIYVQLQGYTSAGSSQRYDVGYFISLDGGDAKSGDCFRDYLPPPLNTISTVTEPRISPFFDVDSDQCGDPEQNKTLLRNIGGTTVASGTPGPPAIIAIPCSDLDGAGPTLEADVSVCTSWDNQSGNVCSSGTDAYPGTGAKCSCNTVTISGITYQEFCASDADCNDNNLCTTDSCNLQTLKCENTAIGAGTLCDDNNLCTTNDVCGGDGDVICLGTPVSCPGDQCSGPGVCDFATGDCINPSLMDGTACDDGQTCTDTDMCLNGICIGTDNCMAPEMCINGICTTCGMDSDCNDFNPCTDDSCNAGTCINTDNSAPCDDGDLCTENDMCSLGSCQPGTPIICNTPGLCEASMGVCIEGLCSYPAATDGTSCDDSDICTENDMCISGICQGTTGACDSDGDGIQDDVDNCPNIANPNQVDIDSDGIGDACDLCPSDPANTCDPGDVDGDGIQNTADNCPGKANANQTDSDSDGMGDACDYCPNDATNACDPGDVDGDGIQNATDNCPGKANLGQEDTDSDGMGDACDYCPNDASNACDPGDVDGDGIQNSADNCPGKANANQADNDLDGMGNACDACPNDSENQCDAGDSDNDGIQNAIDNCPGIANPGQEDSNNNGIGDLCDTNDLDGDGIENIKDNCPFHSNPEQFDEDFDGIGDECDAVNNDIDEDGIKNEVDNCPFIPNPDQIDLDNDNLGDACDFIPDVPLALPPVSFIPPVPEQLAPVNTFDNDFNLDDLSIDKAPESPQTPQHDLQEENGDSLNESLTSPNKKKSKTQGCSNRSEDTGFPISILCIFLLLLARRFRRYSSNSIS